MERIAWEYRKYDNWIFGVSKYGTNLDEKMAEWEHGLIALGKEGWEVVQEIRVYHQRGDDPGAPGSVSFLLR